MGQERRHFTDEFKMEAVALLASSGRPLIQIASELGISPSMLRNWRHRSGGRACGVSAAPDSGVGRAFRPGPGGRDLPASPRERPAAHGARHSKKNCGHLLGTAEMRFRLIEDQRDVWPVRVICDALSVSPSGYYAWRSRPESPRKIANRELLSRYPAGSCRAPGPIWGAAYPCRAACRGPDRQPQAGRAGHAPAWHPGSGAAPLSRVHDRQQAFPAGRGQPAGSEFCGREAQSGLVGGHHLHPDRRGLALPGRDPRSVHPKGGRLGDARAHARRTHHGRPDHGNPAAPSGGGSRSITPIAAASTPPATTAISCRPPPSRNR